MNNNTWEEDWKELWSHLHSEYNLNFETGDDRRIENELLSFISKQISEAEKRENLAWLNGERCHFCGNEMEANPTTNTCANCWQDN